MPITPEQFAVLSRVAVQVARSYHRTHPWLSVEEIQSEAWVTMLESLPKYRPEAGDLGGYLYRCAARAAKVMCWRLSAAANVPERSATLEVVREVRRQTEQVDVALMLPDLAADADVALDRARRASVLAQVVAEHLASSRHAEAVLAVLTGEAKSSEAAEAAGIPLPTLYEATRYCKNKISADPRVQELR